MLSRKFDYGFKLGHMLRDVAVAAESVCDGTTSRFMPLVKELLEEAVQQEGNDADYSRLVRPLEVAAGCELWGKAARDAERA